MTRWAAVAAFACVLSLLPAGAGAGSSQVTGRVENLRGVPLSGVVVSQGGVSTTTGSDGRYLLESVVPGSVTFERVGYAPTAASWDGSADWLGPTMAPRIVRGLHLTGTRPATDSGYQEMLDIAAATSVNSLMIDIKGEAGLVFHQTEVATVDAVGAGYTNPFDLAARTRQAHDAGLYVVTRIVTFEDPIAARARPDWAVKTAGGSLLVHSGQYWLDPTDPAAQHYALELAREACSMGVDEVQFDYVRFPTGDKSTMRFDGSSDAGSRQQTITGFLREARELLAPLGCATAADVFGFITNIPHEGGIGQQLEDLAATIDVISPMIYPSHYVSGWYGFSVPNNHPGPVVRFASQDALDRMTGSQAILRPWLQDFWYTAAQVEIQIVEVDALGLGWMLWNVSSNFTVPGIPTDPELTASQDAPPAVLLPLPRSGFFDVADDHLYTAEIAWLAGESITLGCNPPWGDYFCPRSPLTRGQMAALLARALGLSATESVDRFVDDDATPFEREIEAIAEAGVTLGCASERFCPDRIVTRDQMASFIARALDLEPAADAPFSDVRGVHAPAINALAAAGITNGCAPTEYCPTAVLQRQHAAAFLHRAFAA